MATKKLLARALTVFAALLVGLGAETRAQLLPDAPGQHASESRPLGMPKEAAVGASTKASSGGDSGWMRTGLALGGVVGLIVVLRLALTRLSKRSGSLSLSFGAGGRAPSGVLEVLGRYPVSRGHTLVLLRMDRRVLLLSQSSSGCTTLSEVTDADEVASLLIKTRDEEGATNAARFNELLHQMESDPSIIEAERGESNDNGTGLRGRLARFRGVRA